jgi:hypothetical protein
LKDNERGEVELQVLLLAPAMFCVYAPRGMVTFHGLKNWALRG